MMGSLPPALQSFFEPGRLSRWAGILSRFVALQAVSQALGVLSGIAVVRLLSVHDYGLYTLALTFITATTVLADSGISNVLTGVGGKVVADARRLSALIVTGLRFRRALEGCFLLVAVPVVAHALWTRSAGLWPTVMGAVAIAVSVHAQVGATVMTVVLRLQYRVRTLQWTEVGIALARVVLLVAAVWWWRSFEAAILAMGLIFLLQMTALRRSVATSLDLHVPPDPDDRKEMVSAFRHQFLSALYFAFQSQVTVWLMSVMGATGEVAAVGALGRLSAVFAILGSVLSNIAFPRFARSPDEPKLLLRRYLAVVSAVAAFGSALALVAALFPNQILWVLGPNYAHLGPELTLNFGSSVCYLVVNTMWGLNASRNWVKGSWAYVPLTLLMQAALFPLLDVTSIRGAILFGWYSLLPSFVVNAALTYRGLAKSGPAIVPAPEIPS